MYFKMHSNCRKMHGKIAEMTQKKELGQAGT